MNAAISTQRLAVRVVKVGGSLLDWPPLAKALSNWLAEQPRGIDIVVCGGGPVTDVIRRLDSDFSLGEEAAHWLCVDALSLTARLLVAILPEATFVEEIEQLGVILAAHEPSTIIFDPREFLTQREALLPGRTLPHTWCATTDSIAARLAEVLRADELVLLKSAEPVQGVSLADLADSGYVDGHFPIAGTRVPSVRLVNLRSYFEATKKPGWSEPAGREFV